MNLQELLNSEVKVDFHNVGRYAFYATARIGDREIGFTGKSEDLDVGIWWNVEFYEIKNTAYGGKGAPTFQLTGSGNELQVFSMIKQCLEKLIKDKNPDAILFTADKEDKSRASVYERMLKKFLKGYTIKRYDKNSRQVGFKLEKQ